MWYHRIPVPMVSWAGPEYLRQNPNGRTVGHVTQQFVHIQFASGTQALSYPRNTEANMECPVFSLLEFSCATSIPNLVLGRLLQRPPPTKCSNLQAVTKGLIEKSSP